MWADLADIGRDGRRGGFSRHGFDDADLTMREWFTEQAGRRGLEVRADRNGNLWAWWGSPAAGAIVTGSHLDSVPGGGAFDGPLGVVSALLAVDALRDAGFRPARPLAVVVFAEEEGGRFGVPCLGSRLLTGALAPSAALGLSDPDGVPLASALERAGIDPARVGRDAASVAGIGTFVELHVEQGRGLVDRDASVGVAESILAHGRWRLTFSGEGNHAGTTALGDRRDPVLPAAAAVLAARRVASTVDGARATVGRIVPNPGGTNVIASTVDVWLDARALSAVDARVVVDEIVAAARAAVAEEGCALTVGEESFGDTVVFDAALRDRVSAVVGGVSAAPGGGRRGLPGGGPRGLPGGGPALPTGAGHDAGILAAAGVPAAMLFVRNPTGVSHAPAEHAERSDCLAGVEALTAVLRDLAS
ncbi:MAG TPA: allantoate amidohydrolase [Pseudonocardiaceae bacterium]